MPGTSNTSFIPKKNGVQNDRRTAARQVYVGTLIVRIVFFAALLAVAGVSAYQYILKGDLDAEVMALNKAIDSFNDAEMQRVVSTDKRLAQVSNIMSNTFSVSALLKAVEDSTTESAQITQFSVTRDASNNIEVISELTTSSFDTALFQKNVLEKDDTLSVLKITDLQIQNSSSEPLDETLDSDAETKISFKATLAVDIQKVPHSVDAPILTVKTEPSTASSSNVETPVSGLVPSDSPERNQEQI